MSHTPGPWTIEYENEDGELYDDGVRIDSPEGPVAFNVIDCSAHLIAAAPDLLRELKFAVSVLRDNHIARGLAAALEAIAKAEGR